MEQCVENAQQHIAPPNPAPFLFYCSFYYRSTWSCFVLLFVTLLFYLVMFVFVLLFVLLPFDLVICLFYVSFYFHSPTVLLGYLIVLAFVLLPSYWAF